ncbi:MAG TPA: enoyl-CoA hydratase-related protein [Pyrinomonadaceae bacterium]|jgi:enoyl-CoA hydratase
MSYIIFKTRGPVGFVTLNRPARLNTVTRKMLDELGRVFERIRLERELRAVILTGAGERAFCAGTDIDELARLDVEGARSAAERGQRVCELIERCDVPVIAAVNGLAAGGGCELALACHLRLASTGAVFSLPEIKLGLIPAYGGTQRLARLIGSPRAYELLLTGAQLSAEDAFRTGLVNRILAASQLLFEAEALAEQIAQLAPLATRACLEAVTRGVDLPLAEGLALEAELFSQLFSTEDVREGTRAFLEKRAPVFKGK